jgi:hypothetical protein
MGDLLAMSEDVSALYGTAGGQSPERSCGLTSGAASDAVVRSLTCCQDSWITR